jgi:hypothetical protein
VGLKIYIKVFFSVFVYFDVLTGGYYYPNESIYFYYLKL